MSKKDLLWKVAYLALAGAAFMIDQSTKAWAIRRLRFGGDRSIIPDFLNLAYAQNTGVAFSMLDDHGDAGRWGLSIVAMVAGVLVLYFFWRTPRTDTSVVSTELSRMNTRPISKTRTRSAFRSRLKRST